MQKRVSDSVFLGKATTPEGLRIYAVGDVHGCDRLLADVHRRIAADLEQSAAPDHRIVHIGDYVDRGPDSSAVVERLQAMRTQDDRILCLLGNHDDSLRTFLDDPSVGDFYLSDNIGGMETLRSYGIATEYFGFIPRSFAALSRELGRTMPAEHREFLGSLHLSVRFGDFLIVHAGIRPGVALEAQEPEDLVWIRDAFLLDARDHGVVVIHGHTVADQPEVLPNRINIDTGAVFGGPLTCLVLEGTEYRFL